jgi:hypothetical protein
MWSLSCDIVDRSHVLLALPFVSMVLFDLPIIARMTPNMEVELLIVIRVHWLVGSILTS